MTHAITMLELSDAQLGAIAFAAPFLALAFVWAGGSLLVRS